MDLSTLNREQREAVETLEGPVLILAGAGSGKTKALTYRVANLMDHGVDAERILALTFTNKAAREMKERIAKLVGEGSAERAWIGTFHSTCARILRRDIDKLGFTRSFVIYDDDDQTSVIKEVMKRMDIDDKYISHREVRSKISDIKNRLISPKEWFTASPQDHRSRMIYDVICEYENRLKGLNALDFDDLLLHTLELLAYHQPVLEAYRRRFSHVMVDEYQDTNKAQYEIVRLLTADSRNLCVVGDDDQSIYGWRGADIRNILDFEKDYPDAKVIKLEQNYRSTANILDAANQVIANNEGRKDKKLWTEAGEGEKIKVFCAGDEKEEAAWIADCIHSLNMRGEKLGDMAVLYRTNAQSRVLEDMLRRASMPYRIYGGARFYDRREIKDIVAYMRVLANPMDDISLRRIINVPKRSIGDSTLQELSSHAAKNGIPLYSALSDLPASLSSRPRKCVTEFFLLMMKLSALKDTLPLVDFVDQLIEETGLLSQYAAEDSDEARSRVENIQEMQGSVRDFAEKNEGATVESFLEHVALMTDLDGQEDVRGYITMMTLHSAKGLEFRNVFIAGMEENVFPSYRSIEDENRLEEERRLMYVGITRARNRLYLSRAFERTLYNQTNQNAPSRFLKEIPARLLEDEWTPRRKQAFQGTGFAADPLPTRRPGTRPAKMPVEMSQLGKPKLTFNGTNLASIPGVTKGFVPSKIRQTAPAASPVSYHVGDRVLHRKFGAGVVKEIQGRGAGARIFIAFTAYGLKEFEMSMAPIAKLED